MTRLTRDHHVGLLCERDRITRKGGLIVDGRLLGILEPTRSFGDVDIKEKDVGLIAEPEVVSITIPAGGTLHLVSDGVTAFMNDEEIAALESKVLSDNPQLVGRADPCLVAKEVCTKVGCFVLFVYRINAS